jgi:hypothetical protein
LCNVQHVRSKLQWIELSFHLFTRPSSFPAEGCAQELLLFLASYFMFAFAVLLILKIYPAFFRGGEDSRDSSLEGVCAGDEHVSWLQKGNKPATGGVESRDAGRGVAAFALFSL